MKLITTIFVLVAALAPAHATFGKLGFLIGGAGNGGTGYGRNLNTGYGGYGGNYGYSGGYGYDGGYNYGGGYDNDVKVLKVTVVPYGSYAGGYGYGSYGGGYVGGHGDSSVAYQYPLSTAAIANPVVTSVSAPVEAPLVTPAYTGSYGVLYGGDYGAAYGGRIPISYGAGVGYGYTGSSHSC